MSDRLAAKVAIITGAAGDQGAAEARRFVAEGAAVLLTDIRDEAGAAVAEAIGPGAAYEHLDVTEADDWAAAVARCVESFGPPSILVNNAGVLRAAPLLGVSLADMRHSLDVNVIGALLGMQAVAPEMAGAGGGSIINIASINGLRASAMTAAYSASKFALRGLSLTAAVELGALGIRVNTVCPGAIDTDMTRNAFADPDGRARWFAALPVPRIGRPEEVADLVVFLASDESRYCTGADFVIDGGKLAAG